MPIVFTNWKITKVDLGIFLEAWLPLGDHSRFRSMKAISKFYTKKSSICSGVQDRKKTEFHQYMIPLNGMKIKNSTCGGKGWLISLIGETILVMFSSRSQNPRYPSQSLEEIENLINEVITGIPVVLPASSDEIVTQMINASIKSGSYVQQKVELPIFRRRSPMDSSDEEDNDTSCMTSDLKIEDTPDVPINNYLIREGYEKINVCDEKIIDSHILA